MPQQHRRIAFSNKQKKVQLKLKRERKKFVAAAESDSAGNKSVQLFDNGKNKIFNSRKGSFSGQRNTSSLFRKEMDSESSSYLTEDVEEIGHKSKSRNQRYNLKFRKKKAAESNVNNVWHTPILEGSSEEEVNCDTFYPPGLYYLQRPPWNKNMSKAELDQSENQSFRLFCKDIDKTFSSNDNLSLYELNLETWRQLWRVSEMSDILLIIVDARYPAVHFPPYLYKHFIEKENKGVILILNKCDLLPPYLILAWIDYFETHFPNMEVVPFSSLEGKGPQKSALKLATGSSLKLIEACEKIVNGNVDLRAWKRKVEEESVGGVSEKCTIGATEEEGEEKDTSPKEHQMYKGGVLTIGTIGHPNVGKSSLINALMGKKVVSVSRTPGHTKYFQTIFITKNVKLCDCPGLVFPSLCPKELQVVIGSYPIAQVRDSISVVSYIASRINLPSILRLQHPEMLENSQKKPQWTPFYICEAWAVKRGYRVRTKGGKPDVFRGANELLRFTLNGFKSLILTLKPLQYSMKKDIYQDDYRLFSIHQIQQREANVSKEDSKDKDFIQCRKVSESSQDSSQTEENDHDVSSSEELISLEKETNMFNILSVDD